MVGSMKFRKFAESVLLPFLFFAVALAVRIPRLQEIPRFRGGEMEVTLQLVNGERFPLTNQHPHIGALANYIYALGYWLLGVHYWVPRVLTAIAGALTVSAVYLLARRLAGTRVAVLSALMMAVSVYHVYFISHIPYSNNLTPIFVLLVALTFFRALEKEKPLWLAVSAFVYGMALQTHPSVITLFPALVLLFIIQGKERLLKWIRKPAFYLIIPAVCLGCANLIFYNILTGMGSVEFELTYPKYALQKDPGVHSYLTNTQNEWTLLFRLLGGEAESKSLSGYWQSPAFLLCAAALLAGLVLLIKRRKMELPALFMMPMLILPVINRGYDFCRFGRYLGFLLPMACVLSGYGAVRVFDFLKQRFPRFRILVIAVFLILPVSYVVRHLVELRRTYAVLQNTDTTKVFLQTQKMLDTYDRKRTTLLLDLYSYESSALKIFLESDGWKVEEMANTAIFSLRKGNVAPVKFRALESQVKRFKAGGEVIAIVSPLALKSFLTQAGYLSLDGCLAQEVVKRRNIYRILLNNAYYVFRVTPRNTMGKEQEYGEPLQSLVDIAQFIPADLYRGIPRKRRHGPLRNPDLPSSQLQRLAEGLNSFCTLVPQYPVVPWKICAQKRNDAAQ